MNSKKIGLSIVYKLNMQLLLRLITIFLAIDIFLCMAAGATVVVQSEKIFNGAVKELNKSGLPENTDTWLDITGYRVSVLDREPDGIKVPGFMNNFMSTSTKSIPRFFQIKTGKNGSFFQRIDGLIYSYEFTVNNQSFVFSVLLGPKIKIFRHILLGLLFIQLIILLGSIFSVAKLIRNTLRPIADLAEAARNLNTGDSNFTPKNMELLADKLDDINAAKLDTRIAVEETQDELKNLALAINGLLDRINDSYRSQIRFVSDASHELRTPISVIQGYANLLDRWGKNDEKTLQESINAIKDEAANMKGLVEQLLFLARGDNNTMALQMEVIDLSQLAEEVFRETKMIDGGHEFESNLDKVFIFADKALIKQALRILVDNAIKYTNIGGSIIISVSHEGESATLTVQDDGIGIPSKAVPQIFDRFYRSDQSRARSTGGTGLGLSIAKWIAERHGGYMEVLSRQDIGTRITITIPVTQPNSIPAV